VLALRAQKRIREYNMSATPSPHVNRLAKESSLYLRQHAHNPIDWHPWGPEALTKAKELNWPIFLSIGYSACHWCHVMAHESFENEEIAKYLNEHFVCIKLDREERPDLDSIYMAAVQALNEGQGGWPMSVFLTPSGEPFYAGTYFPPTTRYGRPGFNLVIQKIHEAWATRRDDVLRSGAAIADAIRNHEARTAQPGELGPEHLKSALDYLRRAFDPTNGGLGRAPKFPRPIDLGLLLRIHHRFGQTDALDMTTLTLDKMARGGMYDQIGGGFHRYSVDHRWLVPHFEKMLYDNALLPPVYLQAYQVTENPFYRKVIVETLDYVLKEMTSPPGGFYSTQDADSEGEEGKFYVWSEAEILSILTKEESEALTYVYDVSAEGNWEGHNILNCPKTMEQNAAMLKKSVAELEELLASAKRKLYEVRAKRVWPGRDEKILTAWNAIMLSAFAQSGAALNEPRYVQAAVRAADFVLQNLRTKEGRLLRTCAVGSPAKINAYLEDYAYLCDALVTLYEATFDSRWLTTADELAATMIEQFYDKNGSGFFFTSSDHEQLIARTKDTQDSSMPSGSGMAALALLRLAALTGNTDYHAKAEATLAACAGLMQSSPLAVGQMLIALDFYLGPLQQFAIVGDIANADTQSVLTAIRRKFRPHTVAACGIACDDVPLLKGKESLGSVTTYVCRDFVCEKPLIGAEAAKSV
jgi:uncharacterized protein YyaL (SSP411 family)